MELRAVFSGLSDILDRNVMFLMEVTLMIEQCRQGDAEALGELYKAYAQRMRGVCRRYITDEEAISDILHDAFVIIFTSFNKLRDDSKAEAWMMSITRNVVSKYKDHLKKTSFVEVLPGSVFLFLLRMYQSPLLPPLSLTFL